MARPGLINQQHRAGGLPATGTGTGTGTARAGLIRLGRKQTASPIPSLPSQVTIPRPRTSSRPVFFSDALAPLSRPAGPRSVRASHSRPADYGRDLQDTHKNAIPRDPEFLTFSSSGFDGQCPCPLQGSQLPPSPPFAPRIAPSYSRNPGRDQATHAKNLGTVNVLAGTRNWGPAAKASHRLVATGQIIGEPIVKLNT